MRFKFPYERILAAAIILVALLAVAPGALAHGNHAHGAPTEAIVIVDTAASANHDILPDSILNNSELKVAAFTQSAGDMLASSDRPDCGGRGCCDGAPCTACAGVIEAGLSGLVLPSRSEDLRIPQSLPPASLAPNGLRKPPKSFI